MKDNLRDLFTFSAGERRGIIVLIMLLFLISGFHILVVLHRPASLPENLPEWMKDSAVSSDMAVSGHIYEDPFLENLPGPVDAGPEKNFFDPNSASQEDLQRLGLGTKVSRIIINYRARGGRFDTPEDLKKIYGMSESQYRDIEAYIRIRHKIPVTGANKFSGPPERNLMVDINHADSALLEQLTGIGPVLAKRIIKYRSILGGFYGPQQITEVYGISDSLYQQIMYRLSADTTVLTKINLNKATEKEMARHPYIGRYGASGIIRYRSKVSRIRSINELKTNGLFSDEVFEKIKKYLSV